MTSSRRSWQKVDVEVRHRDAVGIEEALEQQAEAQRVEIRDGQRPGDTEPAPDPRPGPTGIFCAFAHLMNRRRSGSSPGYFIPVIRFSSNRAAADSRFAVPARFHGRQPRSPPPPGGEAPALLHDRVSGSPRSREARQIG
jgi:hypothetical protein